MGRVFLAVFSFRVAGQSNVPVVRIVWLEAAGDGHRKVVVGGLRLAMIPVVPIPSQVHLLLG